MDGGWAPTYHTLDTLADFFFRESSINPFCNLHPFYSQSLYWQVPWSSYIYLLLKHFKSPVFRIWKFGRLVTEGQSLGQGLGN